MCIEHSKLIIGNMDLINSQHALNNFYINKLDPLQYSRQSLQFVEKILNVAKTLLDTRYRIFKSF